jgi:hypothetical protein
MGISFGSEVKDNLSGIDFFYFSLLGSGYDNSIPMKAHHSHKNETKNASGFIFFSQNNA